MNNENKTFSEQQEDLQKENGFLDESKVSTGLNECSLALLHDLFYLSHGAAFYVMQVMRNYETFGSFIAAAADTKAIDFIPDLFNIHSTPKDN